MAKTRAFDAGREHLGTVYAQALLGAAEKAGEAEQVMDELDAFVTEVLDPLPKLAMALSAPKVTLGDKENLIDRALGGKVSNVLTYALKVMARHGRLDCVRDVRRAYRRLYNQLRGRVEVSVRVAAPISQGEIDQIAQRLRAMLGKEVDIDLQVRPEILGGIIVKVGDTLYDGSITVRLSQIREKALASTERQLRQSLDRFITA
jgi:F-type H+-transporting ATPase subunit delta